MKTVYRSILAFSFLLAFTSASLAQKTGYINSDGIIALLPETAIVVKSLEDFRGELDKEIQTKVVAYQNRLGVEQQKLDKGLLTPIQKQEIQNSLQKEQDEIVAFEQAQLKRYDDKTVELYQPIFDKVNTAIQDVAKENGYNLVLDSKTQVIIYSDGTGDLNKLVATKLGIKVD